MPNKLAPSRNSDPRPSGRSTTPPLRTWALSHKTSTVAASKAAAA